MSNLFQLIGSDDFEMEIIKETKPVLVLCMHQSAEFQEQIAIIQDIQEFFNNEIKVCVLKEEFIVAFSQEFQIEGTPTFLVFVGGEEKGRKLGLADIDSLKVFLRKNLLS
jgi:thioredoxin 1